MNHRLIYLLLFVAFVIGGCGTQQIGVTKYTQFKELPFPSNAYASGQIVEIFSKPEKVEITFDPQVPWDQATVSAGWSISGTENEKTKSSFATEITRVLKGSASYNSEQKVKVNFENTQTRIVPKNTIFGYVGKAIKDDPTLAKMLAVYRKNGTHFDVITQTLTANVTFSVVDTNGQEVDIDSEVIKKLNSEFNLKFERQANGGKSIAGTNLVVGIHYDTEMIDLLLQ